LLLSFLIGFFSKEQIDADRLTTMELFGIKSLVWEMKQNSVH